MVWGKYANITIRIYDTPPVKHEIRKHYNTYKRHTTMQQNMKYANITIRINDTPPEKHEIAMVLENTQLLQYE